MVNSVAKLFDTLMDLGVEKFNEQYPDTDYDQDKIHTLL